VVKLVPAWAGTAPPAPVNVYRSNAPLFLAIHALDSEPEAALCYDYAMLWLRLKAKGGWSRSRSMPCQLLNTSMGSERLQGGALGPSRGGGAGP